MWYQMARCLVILLLVAAPLYAQTRCRAPAGASARLGEIDAETRLAYVREELRFAARRTRIWHWSWVAGYSGLTSYQLIYAGVETDDNKRNIQLVGAAGSFVGVLALLIMPRKVLSDQRWLERRLTLARPDEDRCAQLADAERLLARDAADQVSGQGPLQHVGTFVINIGLGLTMGLAFHDWTQAGITLLAGIAIGELQIATQPLHAAQAFERYRSGELKPVRGHGLDFLALPTVTRDGLGVMLAARF